jgi:opacity protein-like surface antigen
MRVELEGLMSTKFEPKDEKNKTFYAEVSVPSALATDDNNLNGITKAAGVFKNNGFSFMAAMLNAYYDFVMSDVMMPYFGIGAGIASVTLDSNQEVSTYPFAGQLKAGVNFNLSKISGTSILPYVGYRLLYFMEKEANDDNILSTDSVVRKVASSDESTPITDAKFQYKMKANTLLHNFEIGFMIPLNG